MFIFESEVLALASLHCKRNAMKTSDPIPIAQILDCSNA